MKRETQITKAEARLQTLAAYERRFQARQRAFGGDGTSSRSGMRGRYGQQKRENVRECCALVPGRSGIVCGSLSCVVGMSCIALDDILGRVTVPPYTDVCRSLLTNL